MKNSRKVIIVGAGPSGCYLAIKLAQKKIDVLLLEKNIFPREDSTCCILNDEAMEYFATLGIKEQILKKSAKVKNVRVVSPNSEETLLAQNFASISSWYLDRLLLDKLTECGVEFWQCAQVVDTIVDDDRVCGLKVFHDGEEQEVYADIIVGADGENSLLARKGNLKNHNTRLCEAICGYFENVTMDPNLSKEGYMELHFEKSVLPLYLWVYPINNDAYDKGQVCAGLKMYDDSFEINMDKMIEIFNNWKENSRYGKQFARANQIGEWTAWQYEEYNSKSICAFNGLVFVGDACSSNYSLVEDGIAFALYTASVAFDAIVKAVSKKDFSDKFFVENYTFVIHSNKQDENKYLKLLRASIEDENTLDNMVRLCNENEQLKQEITNNIFKTTSVIVEENNQQ